MARHVHRFGSIHSASLAAIESAQDSETPSSRDRERFVTGVALAVVGTFLFAIKSILIKFAFAEGVDATTLLTLRMGLSFPFYVGTLGYLGGWRPTVSRTADMLNVCRAIGLGFLGYYLASFLDMSGLELITAQLERLTLFTYPTIIAVLAWMFLNEPLDRRIIFSLFSCYVGLYLMYAQEQLITDGDQVSRGVLLVMGAAVSYSAYVILAKPIMMKLGSRQFTSWAMIGSTVFVAIHFGATRPLATLNVPPIVWLYAMMLSFLCTVIPSFLVNEAIVRLGATRTTVIGSVGPVVTMMLAVLALDEPFSLASLLGMSFVVLGVTVVAQRGTPPSASKRRSAQT